MSRIYKIPKEITKVELVTVSEQEFDQWKKSLEKDGTGVLVITDIDQVFESKEKLGDNFEGVTKQLFAEILVNPKTAMVVVPLPSKQELANKMARKVFATGPAIGGH